METRPIKFRKYWKMSPVEKVVSSKKEYNRNEEKRKWKINREGIENEES